MGCVSLFTTQVNTCVFPLSVSPHIVLPLSPLSSSSLLLTLTVRDLTPDGQLNSLILPKWCGGRITYQSRVGYLSVNGGSLAFGGISGPQSQDNCGSSVC